MSYSFNPTPAEASLLAQIAQRESSGNYSATVSPADCKAMGYTVCTASGAYQFINSTWQQAALATGAGDPNLPAAQNSPQAQDINALWLLRTQGTAPWASSAPAGGYVSTGGDPLVDLSGDTASTSTSDILDQLNASLSDTFTSVGVDPTTGMIALAIGLGLAAVVAMS